MPAAGENFYILDITFMHGGKGFGDDLKDFSKEEGLIPSGTEYSHLKMKFTAIFHSLQTTGSTHKIDFCHFDVI